MRWDEKEIEIALNMINNGKSFKEIANSLNRTHDAVTKKLLKLGYKSGFKPNFNKGKSKYYEFEWSLIQKCYDDGLSYREIKIKFNLSDRAIKWAKDNGKLILRNRSEALKVAWKNGKCGESSKTGLDRYRQLCEFKFSLNEFPNKFNFNLIEKYGWYKAKNRGDNPNGVSRDHMYSVKEGFKNNINPYYLSHPANCILMVHNENNKKKTKCSITLEELINRVEEWDKAKP
jgi:DNA-binding CsgD family transcriptional regulator